MFFFLKNEWPQLTTKGIKETLPKQDIERPHLLPSTSSEETQTTLKTDPSNPPYTYLHPIKETKPQLFSFAFDETKTQTIQNNKHLHFKTS